jgi:mediator of RNA polymerase II transcription subunit 23
VTIDRLVLCLALRTQEQNQEAQLFVIQLLLIKTSQFRDRVLKFVENNSPEYWKQTNWHEKHLAFHHEFPEKYITSDEQGSMHSTLPVYFGNVCLRFLPVLDIIIHRYLEMQIDTVAQSLESVLKTLGLLYKFHDRPITYLYNTLFYYEVKLRDRPSLKRMLVTAIISSLKDVREKNWALTEQYLMYDDATGTSLSYYMGLVKRLIESKFKWFCCNRNELFILIKYFFIIKQLLMAKTFFQMLIGVSMNFQIHLRTHFMLQVSSCWDFH